MNGPTETEVKIRLQNKAAVLERIRAAGFRESVPRQFESNTLYDTSDRRLRNQQMLLRLRKVGDKSIVTWKGPGVPGPHKIRPELETPIGSAEIMTQIFYQLGFEPVFRYEKYRTEFARDRQPGVVTLDETPIGDFLELEGPGEWIDKTADLLGFSPDRYVLDSYGKLYIADCESRGVQPTNMVFASTPG
jgi:adenylate cyclase class 2